MKLLIKSSQLFVGLFLLLNAYTSKATQIGEVFANYPNQDCDWHAGIRVGDAHAVKVGTCNGRSEAWLSKALPRGDGNNDWLVVDHLRLGTLTKNQSFDWTLVCVLPKPVGSVVWFPILDNSRKQPLTYKNGGILQAWRVNAETKRFELVPLALLKKAKCVDESDGQ